MSKSARIRSRQATVPGTLAGAIGLALASASAQAQPRAGDEIVVQGRTLPAEASSDKFTAPLLDTPKSVTIVTSELLEERAATSLVEALKNVPGITFNAGEGGQPAADNLRIRGFDAGADVFVDGVRDAGSQTRDIFALEQVEVVKGPASAYAGRGAAGGTVNLVTKKPRDESFLRANVGAGSDAYLRAALDANYRFGDSAALRLNLLDHDADVPGRDGVFISHQGIAPSLAFGLGKPTRIDVGYYRFRTDDMPDYSIPYGRNADNTEPAGEPVDVDRDTFYGLLNRDFQKTSADIGTVAVEHAFPGGLTLRNTTRYGESGNAYIVTNPDDGRGNVPHGFVLRNAKSRNSETTTRANLTDVTGEAQLGGTAHSFAFGLEVGNERMRNQGYEVETLFEGRANEDLASSCSFPGAVGAPSRYSCTTLLDPDPSDPWFGTITPSDRITVAETDTRSAYAFDTVRFDDRWSLNLGLRYDDYSTRQTQTEAGVSTTLRNDADFWNYQAGLVYKPAPAGSLYVSTGTSSSPSGNTLGDGTENLSEGNADLEPERSRTYEIGTKWALLDGRLSLASAVFRTDKSNARVPIEPGRGAPQLTIGEQRIEGFEIGVVGQLSEAWQLMASYTRLDGEIVDDGPIDANEGNAFPNTPENSASLWTTYDVLPSLTIGAGATYVDMRFGDPENTVWVPSYVTYDAMVSWRVAPRMQLRLNVQNATDETYFTRPYRSHYAAIGPGRLAILSFDYEL
ncbi:MAG TPA: TonB-dependent receptor [Gammaproteobacteria bacterium]